jgi:hypothetical protein
MSRLQKKETLRSIAERYVLRLGLEERKEEILENPQRFLQELAFLMRSHFQREI